MPSPMRGVYGDRHLVPRSRRQPGCPRPLHPLDRRWSPIALGRAVRDRLLGAGVVVALFAVLAVDRRVRGRATTVRDIAASGRPETRPRPVSSTSTVRRRLAGQCRRWSPSSNSTPGGKFDHPVPITYLTAAVTGARPRSETDRSRPRGHDRPETPRGVPSLGPGRPTSTSRAPTSSSRRGRPRVLRPGRQRDQGAGHRARCRPPGHPGGRAHPA